MFYWALIVVVYRFIFVVCLRMHNMLTPTSEILQCYRSKHSSRKFNIEMCNCMFACALFSVINKTSSILHESSVLLDLITLMAIHIKTSTCILTVLNFVIYLVIYCCCKKIPQNKLIELKLPYCHFNTWKHYRFCIRLF